MADNYTLVVIVGPTAVGKTEFSIHLAKYFRTEIISADSRQFYRELNIGTAKPDKGMLKSVRHHFINSHSIHEYYNAGQFAQDVHEFLRKKFKENPLMIMTGGSGMYIQAVCSGLNKIPEVPQNVRSKYNDLLATKGLDHLRGLLKSSDPQYFAMVDQSNPQRIIRALEVIDYTGESFSSFQQGEPVPPFFKTIKIGLTMERDQLYARIDDRIDQMIQDGLFDEASNYFDIKDHYALKTVGYKEVFDFMAGNYGKEETIRLIKRNSRRYAKRQLTWFRRDPEITWFAPEDKHKAIRHIERLHDNQKSS